MSQLALDPADERLSFDSTFLDSLEALGVAPGPAWPDRFGEALSERLKPRRRPIKALSLFAGGGGLDIGFHDCGIRAVEAVEIEAKYVATLERNAEPGGYLHGLRPRRVDIKEYDPPADVGHIDLVIGGPPCQTFSAAGRRASGVRGTSDPRGVLFQEYVRLLEELRPRAFLFENVYGITGAQGGDAWREIEAAFQGVGYATHHRVLDAADYGVPQHRERLFIVGTREGSYRFPRPTHGPDSPGELPFYSAGEAVGGVGAGDVPEGIGGHHGHLLNEIPPGLNYSFFTAKLGHPRPIFAWRSKFSDYLYKADPEAPVRTIKAQGGQYTGPFSWENRRFSLAELKRLQTFPDCYKIVGGRQVAIEQIGNSVPPQIARILALSVLDRVFGIQLPIQLDYLAPSEKLGFRTRKRLLTAAYAEKARLAHASQKPAARAAGNGAFPAKATRYLSKSFRWSNSPVTAAAAVHTRFSSAESVWDLSISTNGWRGKASFGIEVSAAAGVEWELPAERVLLRGQQLEGHVFTAAWRALEEAVATTTGVADLVQLNGYYQYTPRLKAQMSLAKPYENDEFWRLVAAIVEGAGLGQTASLNDLATMWCLPASDPGDLASHLLALREIGYEVRSHNTNPQIPKGHYLVPYAFPTLTPQSVQLRKAF
jgi:DNA (cytosine-5)-methyltransferase 1